MTIAFDTNILGYLAGVVRVSADAEKVDAARRMQGSFSGRVRCFVSIHALGELNVLLMRLGHSREIAGDTVRHMMASLQTTGTSVDAFVRALDLAATHKLQFWDSVILSVAAEARCALLLSEDMQDGFFWQGVTVTNPFVDTGQARITRLLQAS